MEELNDLVGNSCKLCPRECGVDRNKSKGLCKTSNRLEIASYNVHCGEEPPVSGKNGSGTIFFAGCNLGCIYCQNYPISQLVKAKKVISTDGLANIMLELQRRKAHNINLVTPSHFVHLIVEAVKIAKNRGLKIPIIYNTSSYDKEEVIYALDNFVDVYLSDLKYADDKISKELSGVSNYFNVATRAILAMHETKGELILKDGLAKEGLIVRHLVLPGFLENTEKVLRWLKNNISNVTVSIMFQYFPVYKALSHSKINRKVNVEEYFAVLELVDKLNLNGFVQEI